MQTALPAEIRQRLTELAQLDEAGLAERIGVHRVTLARALAGLKVQRGSLAMIRQAYESMKGKAP